MANFCVKCGSALTSGPFCTKCGADARSVPQSAQPQPAAISAEPTQVAFPPAQPGPQPVAAPTAGPAFAQPAAKQGMSTLAKLGIAAVAIIFVGGMAGAVGVYYIAHRVGQKIHQATDGILGSDSTSGTASHGDDSGLGRSESGRSAESGTMGDVCRLLSKEDVSKAIGVEIVRTQSEDNGCSYIAKGTQADMTAKHITAMAKDRGADAQAQKIVQTFAGTLFNSIQNEHPDEYKNENGEVPVFVFSIDNHSAEVQMRLNSKVMGNLGPGPQGLPGIGDQAFDLGNAMIMVRKGDKLIRIAYMTCPCNTNDIKPLAKLLADRV